MLLTCVRALKYPNVLTSVRFLKTSVVPQARFQNRDRNRQNPGISERATLYENDPEFLEALDNEQDCGGLEIDSSKLYKAYDKIKKDESRNRQHIKQIIANKKFFKPPKQPNMLTWNEKHQIKLLHARDPTEWTVERLSESFPATKDIITRILKIKWKPESIEKMKRKDEKVAENWKLLEQDKLEALPHVLKHLKKFSSRREALLAQINSPDSYQHLIEEKKEEENWNNGKMKSILVEFEKSLKSLEKQQLGSGVAQISSGEQEKEDLKSVLKDRIEFDTKFQRVYKDDNFVLGGSVTDKTNPVTLDELGKEIIKDYATGKSLDVSEKLILESTLKQKVEIPEVEIKEQIKQSLDTSKLVKPNQESSLKQTVELSGKIASTKGHPMQPKFSKPVNSKLMNLAGYKMETDNERNEREKSNTISVEKVLSNPVKQPYYPISQVSEAQPYEYKTDLEKLEFEQEEADVKDTCFWDTSPTIQDTQVPAVRKPAIAEEVPYPLKIEIPRNKQGSGLTFKVEDCFYDDDGEFLYRVPGLVK